MTETYDGPFSLLQMFWGSITARPLRSFLSVIAIAIQVILVLMIAGLTSGVISEWGKRVEGVGADILVQPPNSSIFFAFLSVGMQESLGGQIAALSGVDEVAPTVILTEPKNLVMVYGIDYQRFNALSKGFLFRDGRPFEGPDEVIADDIMAQTRHLKVGSQITLLNHAFTVCGIVGHGKGARYFIPIRTAQEIAGAEKRVSMFYVRSKGDTEGTRAQILKLMPENSIRSLSEYVTLMTSSNLPQLRPFTRTMVALGIVAYLSDAGDFKANQPRLDDPDFPGLDFFRDRARTRGSRNRGRLPRAPCRQLRPSRRSRLRIDPQSKPLAGLSF